MPRDAAFTQTLCADMQGFRFSNSLAMQEYGDEKSKYK